MTHGDEDLSEIQGFRLSPQQARLWRRIAAGEASGWVARCRVEIDGPLDEAALQRALGRLAARWEILRTGFRRPPGMAEPLQVIAETVSPVLETRSLAGLDQLAPPADLARPPLVAAALAPLGPEKVVLALALPALAADDAALDLLVRELAAAYGEERGEAGAAAGGEEPLQYADLADWLCELLESPETEEGRAYWGRQEIAAPAAADLPLSRPLAQGGAFAPARCAVALPPGCDGAALAGLARSLGAGLADLLAAAWGVLLARLTGSGHAALAVTFTGRKLPELEGALGTFASRIPVPLALPADLGFAAAVAEAAAALAERHGFEEVFAEELLPGGLAPELPELPFAFAHLPALPRVTAGGATFAVTAREVIADRFLVELRAEEGEGGDLALALRYDGARLAAADAELLAARFAALLAGAVARPEAPLAELPLLGAAERERLVHAWNDTRRDLGSVRTLHGLFAAQAARTPGQLALESETEDLTYAALDAASGTLAATLAARGVGRGDIVALCLDRSPHMVIAMLAVMRADAAFLPVEPGHPAERRAWMLADARPALALVGEGSPADFVDGRAVPVLDLRSFDFKGSPPAAPATGPDDLAYVIYTSGSSGRPKGVAVAHGAITNRLLWMQSELPVDTGDAVLQKTPYGFDASLWEIFVPLATGARLVLASPGAHGDVAYLARTVAARGVTVLQLVPSLLGPFLACEESALCRGRLRRLFCGGEALPVELAVRAFERLGLAPVNLYGPTEAAIDAACHVLSPADLAAGREGVVPIGRPIANDRIYLLDERGWLAPQGARGEVAIGGAGLARGYLGRPDLTAERFVPDAWSGEPGERLYLSGDLARRRADGALEYLGRIDGQVKIRGVRIELGEVEAALARIPGVAAAAAALHSGLPGGPRLVAYVVPSEGAHLEAGAVRALLAASLPGAMVPSDVVALTELPRLPSGKVDRRSLPAPDQCGDHGGYVAPRTPTEQMLAERMATLLGCERVGVLDNVFDLGFHSLLATQLGSRLRRTFGVAVPLRSLFELPTVAELAARIDAGLRGDPRLEAPPVVRAPRSPETGEPLSFAQRRLWFLDQMQPGSPFYNIPIALSLAGRLDRAAFAASVAGIVRRHESLRTAFDEVDSEPVQRIAPAAAVAVPVPTVDLAGLPEAARRAEASRLARLEALRPFDLERGPLLRVALLRLEAEEHLALFTLHHIVSDGWSTGLVTRELAALYTALAEGRPAPLPEPELQYADYARWQRDWLGGEALEALTEFWRRELGDAPPRLDLPGDRLRPAAASTRGGARSRLLPPELVADVERLARTESATLFMVVLAAGAALLGWLAGVEDLVIGTDVAGRNRAETEGIVGFFINQLALRCRLGGDPEFRELVARVREATLTAYAHQDLPFDKLVEILNPERSRAFAPIFQAKINLHNMPAPPLELPGLTIAPVAVARATAQFDWILNLTPLPEGMQAAIEYSADLFDPPTVDRMLALLEALLAAVVARPGMRLSEIAAELAAADAAERERSLGSRQRERHRQLQSVRRQAVEAVAPEGRP
jgi:amino acid adenylation domain-containing protein